MGVWRTDRQLTPDSLHKKPRSNRRRRCWEVKWWTAAGRVKRLFSVQPLKARMIFCFKILELLFSSSWDLNPQFPRKPAWCRLPFYNQSSKTQRNSMNHSKILRNSAKIHIQEAGSVLFLEVFLLIASAGECRVGLIDCLCSWMTHSRTKTSTKQNLESTRVH